MSEDLWLERVQIPPEVLHQTLPDGETVFLNLTSEQYYGLDATATQMWQALAQSDSVADAHEALLQDFDADPDTLRADLLRLLRRLLERGLLVVADS